MPLCRHLIRPDLLNDAETGGMHASALLESYILTSMQHNVAGVLANTQWHAGL